MSITRRGIIAGGAIALITSLGLAGCSNSNSLSGSTPAASGSAASKTLVIGSTPYPETQTVSEIYGQALAANGYTVTYKLNVGQRATLFPALKSGAVNFTPEYVGSIVNFLGNTKPLATADEAKTVLDGQLKPLNLTALNPAPATDSDAIQVTKALADKYGLTSIADLKKVPNLTLAANPEFSTRPDGIKELKSLYGLTNIKFKAINDGGGQATVKALTTNQVQAADVYTTSTLIAANNLVTLTDPKAQFGAQNLIPIVTTAKVDSKLTSIVNTVSAALTQSELVSLDDQVFTKKVDPAAAAKAWLAAKNLSF